MDNLMLVGVIALILIFVFISKYNRLIKLQNNREKAFADIDVQLKQRHNIVPQLIDAVKGYLKHESELLNQITHARSSAINASSVNDKISAEKQLNSVLNGLKVAVEAYPDLKSSDGFLSLQTEIANIENRLAAVRRYFNSATTEYNNAVEVFPSNLIAKMFGFKEEEMFEIKIEDMASLDSPTKIDFS